ncbi:putative GTP-binding protein 6 [Nasonia vitripennis]|uniref:Hflx-type G domain-containing protein n=1 Tax=Nasonia vitripennis TaxID=7425 RepID=A0A7M7GC53_NASVI|nr:putative GTP-binding protein 6 [Nasonia vitripennis]XP_003424173.1 putative GTP-binding protein 6 [Nasonia vitripennis]
MNSIFKRLTPLAKSGLLFGKQTVQRKTWFMASRFRYEDTYFHVDEEKELENPEYNEISNEYLGAIAKGHRTFVIQPYIKWGKGKKYNTNRDLQLAEAVALVETLPHWTVVDKMCVPLLTLEREQLFGSGSLENVKTRVKCGRNVTAIFISTNTLKHVQLLELEKIFGVPVYDRYSLVIHIFRCHAMSPEAKLQVALAELPYIYKKMSELCGRINLLEKRRLYLQAREAQLRTALKKLKNNRDTIRKKRKNRGFATVAVVGYTNAGKTSLIKALTSDEMLKPRNVLFATLDTTAHEGYLPCNMKVLYIDTIGFIQDVPETLIEPFVATLDDAMIADIIVHVYDASHPDKEAQIDHVRKTLKSLTDGNRPLIEVANKCDLIEAGTLPEETLGISAKTTSGIDVLRHEIEKKVLSETGRSVIKMRVESGSEAAAWLYKEATVVNAEADPKDPQFLLLDVVVTENTLHRFRRFLKQ